MRQLKLDNDTSQEDNNSNSSQRCDAAAHIAVGANGDAGDQVTIIHFNDCYNIEAGPESCGAAGFLTAINQHRHLNPMILFSGDIISPSFMSTFTKGEQMIPVLNDIGVHCAVFGNHEFDYGVDNLIDFVKRTTFPWLLSNVIDKETSNQLGDGQVYYIIERANIKFGLIGLIEEEWLSTLSTLDSSDVIYQDFVETGRTLAKWLKSEPNNVDFVIALTHFRTPNDIRLADAVPEIDLILGGHDHDYEVIKRPNCHIIKSGTDFREFSKITLKPNPSYVPKSLANNRDCSLNGSSASDEITSTNNNNNNNNEQKPFKDMDIEHIMCLSYKPDEQLKKKLEKFVTSIDEKMGKVLGQFNCDLDGRFSSIRNYETNLGNFVCDIMLASTHADVAILNSGTLRSDRIHPKGDFTMRDLFNILGYIDPIAVLQASGYHIWKALENGVSQWPKLEGRFPQVSGCSFTFDPKLPPMSRINPKDITVGDEPLVLDKHYNLTTKAYLASGKDGYDMLKECKVLVPGDESPDLTTSILNHFEAISIIKSNRRTHHRQSIICLSRSSMQKLMSQTSNASSGSNANNNNSISNSCSSPTTACTVDSTTSSLNNNNNNNNNNNIKSANRATYIVNNTSNSSLNTSKTDESEDVLAEDKHQHSVDSATTTSTTTTHGMNNTSITTSDRIVEESADDLRETKVGDSRDESAWPSQVGDSGAMGTVGSQLNDKSTQVSDFVPTSSSPLVGTVAPAPTVRNMLHEHDTMASSLVSSPETPSTIQRHPRTKRVMSLYEMEHEQCKLEPKTEGRIRILGVNVPCSH